MSATDLLVNGIRATIRFTNYYWKLLLLVAPIVSVTLILTFLPPSRLFFIVLLKSASLLFADLSSVFLPSLVFASLLALAVGSRVKILLDRTIYFISSLPEKLWNICVNFAQKMVLQFIKDNINWYVNHYTSELATKIRAMHPVNYVYAALFVLAPITIVPMLWNTLGLLTVGILCSIQARRSEKYSIGSKWVWFAALSYVCALSPRLMYIALSTVAMEAFKAVVSNLFMTSARIGIETIFAITFNIINLAASLFVYTIQTIAFSAAIILSNFVPPLFYTTTSLLSAYWYTPLLALRVTAAMTGLYYGVNSNVVKEYTDYIVSFRIIHVPFDILFNITSYPVQKTADFLTRIISFCIPNSLKIWVDDVLVRINRLNVSVDYESILSSSKSGSTASTITTKTSSSSSSGDTDQHDEMAIASAPPLALPRSSSSEPYVPHAHKQMQQLDELSVPSNTNLSEIASVTSTGTHRRMAMSAF